MGESAAVAEGEELAVGSEPTAPTEPTSSAEPRKKNRAAFAGAVGLVYVLLAAGTAAAVVAVAAPAPVNTTALGDPTGSAGSATATAAATLASNGAGSTGSVAIPPPPTIGDPLPTSTVTGAVSNGVHTGDLRYFLLPAPQGPSSVQGAPDGTAETIADVVTAYGGGSTKQNLTQLHFVGAVTRTYQDSDLGANVTVNLLQFDSHTDAAEWLSLLSKPAGVTAVTVPGETGSVNWFQAGSGNYWLNGNFVEGDTFYSVAVYSVSQLGDDSLTNLMNSQYDRLANG